eukprot:10751743-Alexandrium_andersonii.AAC.1
MPWMAGSPNLTRRSGSGATATAPSARQGGAATQTATPALAAWRCYGATRPSPARPPSSTGPRPGAWPWPWTGSGPATTRGQQRRPSAGTAS